MYIIYIFSSAFAQSDDSKLIIDSCYLLTPAHTHRHTSVIVMLMTIIQGTRRIRHCILSTCLPLSQLSQSSAGRCQAVVGHYCRYVKLLSTIAAISQTIGPACSGCLGCLGCPGSALTSRLRAWLCFKYASIHLWRLVAIFLRHFSAI